MEFDMREKDDSARGKILEAAKAEFLERGFAEASMRTIAERAGFTTGMLYSRFADKSEIFRELVEGPADELYNYFMTVQNEFAAERVCGLFSRIPAQGNAPLRRAEN